MMTAVGEDRKQEVEVLDRKIAIATECFTTNKFCELVLKDRNRLSIENTLIGMTSIPVRVNLTSVAGINAWSTKIAHRCCWKFFTVFLHCLYNIIDINQECYSLF